MRENNNNESGLTSKLSFLLVGGGIGAVLALLFAPKSGVELRGDIADVSRRGYDATVEKASDLKSRSTDVLETVKEKAGAAYDFASAKINAGTDKIAETAAAAGDAVADKAKPLQKDLASQSRQQPNDRESSNSI